MDRHNTPEAAASKPTSRAADQNAGLVPILRYLPRSGARPPWMVEALAALPPGRPDIIVSPAGKKYLVTATGSVRKLDRIFVSGRKFRSRMPDIITTDAYNQLHDPEPDDDTLRDVISRHRLTRKHFHARRPNDEVDHVAGLMRRYRERFGDLPRSMHVRSPIIECGPPGTPWDKRKFRSQWEERTGKALTRLGIRWAYEPRSFDWVDGGGRWHNYTPDFQLLDLHITYAEVKGPAGAYGDDQFKMAQVLRSHPQLTLLLWDADVVESLEDMDSAAQFVNYLSTTRLAAA